ncbi:MAG TPA: type II toxin-antitoxin system RelE/ParE family toxin [Bacteroidota bacterium]|nr:type II toxin-antitoxin system RelE/ParE family toxin [Bacteroidota bacterium]
MYSVRLLKAASKDLEKLERTVARRIIDRLEWLSTNLDSTKLFPLKGELKGLYKLREGSHRIIFEVLRSEKTIIVHAVGHRREIYNRR